jgi:hypothetical protein
VRQFSKRDSSKYRGFEMGLLAAGGLIAFHFRLKVAMAHSIRLQQLQEGRDAGAASRPTREAV